MSKRSSRPSTKTKNAKLDRPFAPTVLRRAREIAAGYRFIIERCDDGGYMGRSVEFPCVLGGGPSPEECVRQTLLCHVGVVATMLEAGERPPIPHRSAKRRAQINVRVTQEEKLLLEDAAQGAGFRNISEFVRTTALRAISAA